MNTARFQVKWREFTNVLRNELHSIFHDGGVILIVIGAILIYATAYALAYKNEVLRDIPVAVVDLNRTPSSRALLRTMDATPNVKLSYEAANLEEAKQLFYDRKINGIIVVPSDYEKLLMRGQKANLAVYADASYFLMYRQVFFDITGSVLSSGSGVERQRLMAAGAQDVQAVAVSDPVHLTVTNLYNPYGGYASFIMPAIIILILQQTLLIGIGMVGGTWREKHLYGSLIPKGERRLSTLPIVLGRSTAYALIYVLNMTYVLGIHYRIFGYPMNGQVGDVLLFLTPYLLSCIFMGMAASTLFKYRENSLILLLFTSIPFLMLSGASVPFECMPSWLVVLGKVIPSSSGIDGFLRIQTMGATLREVMPQWGLLWVLTGFYFILACMGMRRVIRMDERRRVRQAAKARFDAN